MLKKHLQVRGHKLFVLITGIIYSFLFIHHGTVVYATDLTDPSRYIYDTNTVEATILMVRNEKEADIRVDKILNSVRHPQAEYVPLAVADEITVNFLNGTHKRVIDNSPLGPSPSDTILPGVKTGDTLQVQIDGCNPIKPINCHVADLGAGYFIHDYSLSNLVQQNNTKTPYEIYTLLINNKRVDSDVHIDFTADGQNYSAVGSKKVKLLFVIPTHLKFKFVIDPITGQIKSVQKPWWEFLTKQSL